MGTSPKAIGSEREIIANRFVIRRRLGEGAFGVVFEAEDRRDGGRVALKLLRQPESNWLYLFKQEFRVIQGLSHPNLVAMHELFCDDGRWFLTMEMIDGVDLLSYVRGRASVTLDDETMPEAPARNLSPATRHAVEAGHFDEQRLRHSLRQLLEGLAALHGAGKVHRDIKPANVLVTREGRVVLLDFGLTTEAFGSIASSVMGTPAYMAPEQAASIEVGPPADQYAVGVMLYELLTGRVPIGGTALQVLLAKQSEAPPPPAALTDGVPDDLNTLCRELLHVTPSQRPTALEAFRRVAEPGLDVSPAFSSVADTSLFVGRQAELATLRRALEAGACGELTATLVCGESGIGKSLMVRRFLTEVSETQSETLVLEARCHEREAVPFKTLDGIIDALSRRLARMPSHEVAGLLPARAGLLAHVFPVLLRVAQIAKDHARVPQALPPQELRQRAFAALRELFMRVAVQVPTVLAIDDLQWADEDGLLALCEVLRPPDPPPLMFIGTLRTHAGGAARVRDRLAAALQDDLHTIELAHLSPEETRALALALLDRAGVVAQNADWIAAEAAGHPLFVEELTRHVALSGSAPQQPKLDAAIWSRIHQLESGTSVVVELTAIAGKPLALQLVAAAAKLPPAHFREVAASLRSANLVRTRDDGTIEPYHDRVREAVLARLPPERKRALHETLARTIEAGAQRDHEALANHWFEAGDSARSATWAAAAGDEAARAFAFDRAARCYEQALACVPQTDSVNRTLRIKLADALALAGRGALAAPHFESAAFDCEPGEALELRRRAAEQLLRAGLIDRGLAASRDVLRSIGMRLPRNRLTTLASLAWYLLRVRLRGLRFEPRVASAAQLTRIDTCWSIGWNLAFVESVIGYLFCVRALLLSLAAGDRERITCSLAMVAALSSIGGGRTWRRTERYLRHATELAARSDDFRTRVIAAGTSGGVHHMMGRFRLASEQLTDVLAWLDDGSSGLVHERVMIRMFLLQALMFSGGFRALRLIQREGLLDAFARGDVYATVNLRIGSGNLAWLIEDRPEYAEEQAREAIEQWSKQGFHNEHVYELVARINARSYAGDVESAYALANELLRRGRRSLAWRIQVIRVRTWYARGGHALAMVAAGQGDRASLLRIAAADARALEGEKLAWIRPFATVLRAGLDLHAGARAQALRKLDLAVREFVAGDLRGFAVAVRARAAVLRGNAAAATSAADALRAEDVVNPERMIRVLVPGFDFAT